MITLKEMVKRFVNKPQKYKRSGFFHFFNLDTTGSKLNRTPFCSAITGNRKTSLAMLYYCHVPLSQLVNALSHWSQFHYQWYVANHLKHEHTRFRSQKGSFSNLIWQPLKMNKWNNFFLQIYTNLERTNNEHKSNTDSVPQTVWK